MPAWLRWGLLLGLFLVLLLLPRPEGLSVEGQRTLAVTALAVLLWSTEALPPAVTALLTVLLLALVRAVGGLGDALYGFSSPTPYFLLGVLTIGLAVLRVGLAERVARFFLSRARGSATALYGQMVLSFPLMTFIMPSAMTRTGILVYVYDQALELCRVPRGSDLAKAIMMALTSMNRLASTALLTGGIAPIMAAAIIGSLVEGFSWTRWFVLMSVPYYLILVVGGLLLYLRYRGGLRQPLSLPVAAGHSRLTSAEVRVAVVLGVVSLLWLTDPLHHLHPAVPALVALVALVSPGLGVLTWQDMERDMSWSTFFVLGTSLSLAQALMASGAATWLASFLAVGAQGVAGNPLLFLISLMVPATVVRLAVPSLAGYLALTIPVGVSLAQQVGVNPVAVALALLITGDAVLYYPAQSPSSLLVYQRGHLRAGEIFRFGVVMTLVAYGVLLAVALSYWSLLGEGLFQ